MKPKTGPVRACGLMAALCANLLAACVTQVPYERPPAPVAATFPNGVAASGSKTAVQIDWQDYFNDVRLKTLIDAALRNNRDLRLAALNIEQARAQAQIRRADLYPSVGIGLSGTRTPTGPGSASTLYSAGFSVTGWEADFFGRLASLKDSALAQYLASEESRQAAHISLVGAVANAYLNLLADEELLSLTRQTLLTREDSYRLTRLRFDNGASSEIDLRQAESLSEGARATLAQLQRQRALDENALVLLLGQPLPTGFDLPAAGSGSSAGAGAGVGALAQPLQPAPVMAELPAGLPSDLLANRPDIRAAEQQLLAAHANIGAARAAFFPRISLTGSLGLASSELSGLLQSGAFAFSAAAQALLPIFDAGRNQAGLEAAQASRDSAIAQYEKAIQVAFREVADALAGRATYGEQLRAQQAQADAEAVRLRLADLRYRNGVASYLDLLDAQRSLFAARQAVLLTRLAQLQNQVVLYKVLGGGWSQPARN